MLKNICLASDNNYFNQLSITILSLLEHCLNPKKIKINVLDNGITNKNKNKLKKIVIEFGSEIKFIKPNISEYSNLKKCGHLGINTYLRLDVPKIFKKEKVIYLDSDLIILGDILDLFKVNLKGKTIGAVSDYVLDLKNKNNEFNAGVMIINSSMWNSKNYYEKFFRWAEKNEDKIHFADQCILNGILKNDWKKLPLEWNRQKILLDYPRILFNLNKKNYDKLIKSPKIIHFTGKIKPWHYKYIFPDKKLYEKYLKRLNLYQNYYDKNLINRIIYKPLRWLIYKLKLRHFIEEYIWLPKNFR